MRFVYLFFLVISVCVLSGFSYALDISGCTDLNSDYIDQTLTLTQDINGWVGSCFQLTEDASGKYFELDCTGHNIDFNSDDNSFRSFFDTNSFDIDSILVSDCNFSQIQEADLPVGELIPNVGSTMNVFDINSDINYIYFTDSNYDANFGSFIYGHGLSDSALDINLYNTDMNFRGNTFAIFFDNDYNQLTITDANIYHTEDSQNSNSPILVFYDDHYVNELNILDSYLNASVGYVLVLGYVSENLDINFYDSYVYVGQEDVLEDYLVGFALKGNQITITNLDLNYSPTNVLVGNTRAVFKVESDSFTLTNSNIVSDAFGRPFIFPNNDLNIVNIEDSNLILNSTCFYDAILQDSNLSFDFNNVDANYLLFKDLNLDLDYNLQNYDTFINVTGDSNISNISFENSDIKMDEGLFITLNTANITSVIDFSNLDLNLWDTGKLLFVTNDSNVDLNFYNLNINYSDFNLEDQLFVVTGNSNALLKFSNNDYNLSEDTIFISNFLIGINGGVVEPHQESLSLQFFDTNINYLKFSDSNIKNYSSSSLIEYNDGSDINYITIENPKISFAGGGFFIDYKKTTEDDFLAFNFDNVDANELTFNDLNVSTDLGSTSFITINNNSDLNNLEFQDSSIDLQNSTFFDYNNSIVDDYLSFTFNNTDANYLLFKDLNIYDINADFFFVWGNSDLNYIEFVNSNLSLNDSTLFNFSQNTDDSLKIDFGDSNLNLNGESNVEFYFLDCNYNSFSVYNLNATARSMSNYFIYNLDSYLDNTNILYSNLDLNKSSGFLNYSIQSLNNDQKIGDYNFYGTTINFGGYVGFLLYDTNTVNIYNLNDFNFYGVHMILIPSHDVNKINIVDSNINVFGGYFLTSFLTEDLNLDLNFSNSLVTMYNDADFIKILDSNYGFLSIYNLNLNSDENSDENNSLFYLDDGNVVNLLLTDSNIVLDEFAYLDINSNIGSSQIYNNIFQDVNTENTFIYAPNSNFNADFNTSLTLNSAKRQVWLIDDSNYVGGNLWLNLDGNNLCTTDNDAPYGICDSNIQLLGSDENYYDHLALIDYSDVDLSPTDIRLSGTQAGTITVYCDVNNLGGLDATSDYNVSFYVDNSLQTTTNVTTDINVGEMNTTSFSWTASAVTYDLNCLVDYNGTDTNSENDNREETFTITSGTDGPVGGSDYDVHLSAVYAGKISKSENVIITSNISKSGSKVVPSSKYKLYVLDKGSKKELYSEDFANFDLPKSIQKTITKADLLKIDLNFLNFIDNEKITFSVEIDVSGDKDKKDNNKTLNVPAEYFDLKLLGSITGKISKINKATITGIVTKVQGTESIDAGTVKLYALEKGEKKEIAQSSFTNSQLPYNFIKEIGLNDLNGKVNLYDATDDSGTLEFVLELSVDGDSDLGNNTKSVYSKIEYLDLKLKEAYLLKGENKIPLTNSGKAEFEIKTNYKLHCLLEHTSINKAGSAKVTFGNKTKPHKINEQILDLGKLNGKQQKTMDYEVNINLLDLMSETEAIDTIISVLGLDIKDPETEKIVEKIIADLKKDQFSVDLDLFLDKILFAGLEDEFELIFTGSDLSDSKFNFNLSYVLESKEGVEDKEKAGKEGSEGSGKETSGDNIVLKPEDIFLLTYKSKLGFGELQTIFVFNGKKEPRKNLNLLVVYNDKNWQFKTDENGKVEFLPEFEGKYRLEVPYPNPKVKGEFEVISGYISTSSDFVELSNNVLTSESSTKTKSYLLYLGIGLLIAIGIVLYFLFRPKKPEQYDFLKTNTNLMYQTTFPSWYLK